MTDAKRLRVLGFSGSLRANSLNRAALRAAVELAPDGMTIETFDLSPIPLYDEDVRQQGFPPSVQDFRALTRPPEGRGMDDFTHLRRRRALTSRSSGRARVRHVS